MESMLVTKAGPFCRNGLPPQADLSDVLTKNRRRFIDPHALRSRRAAKSCPAGRTCWNYPLGCCLMMLLLVGCELTQEPKNVNEADKTEKKTAHTQEAMTPSAILDDMGLSLVPIQGGQFQMGSIHPEQYGEFSRCEGPRHLVQITRDFRISRTEVTVGQFRTFVAATGHVTDAERTGEGCNGLDVTTGGVIRRPECVWTSPGFEQSEQHPVVCVSWADTVAFCEWLSEASGQPCRLPTEAEWEYCCRAGNETLSETDEETLSEADTEESLQRTANCGDQSLQSACSFLTATAGWDDGFAFTAPVGSFTPNRFGLHDMHGNVGEWCRDWFDAEYYARSAPTDPQGPATAQKWHVVRGGSWYNGPASCRPSGRHDGIPTEASTTNGFRIVVEIPDSR